MTVAARLLELHAAKKPVKKPLTPNPPGGFAALTDFYLRDQKSTPKRRKSPIKSARHYEWHHYRGEPHTITSSKGYSATLVKGHKFGLRPAKSDPEKVRLVHQDTGLTKIFSITKNRATRLKKVSRPVK